MTDTPDEYVDDFRWWSSSASDGKIVLYEQPATAIYIDDYGAIAIRQQADQYEERDSVVLIQPENLRKVVTALAGFLRRWEGKQS